MTRYHWYLVKLRFVLALAGAVLVGLGPAVGAQKKAARPASLPGVQVLRDLEYVQGGHDRNRLDLYLPEKATRPLPPGTSNGMSSSRTSVRKSETSY